MTARQLALNAVADMGSPTRLVAGAMGGYTLAGLPLPFFFFGAGMMVISMYLVIQT